MKQFLSGLKYDSDNSVIGADAVMDIWILAEQEIDDAMEWELGFIEETVDGNIENDALDLKTFGLAERSYDDEIMFVVYSNVVTLLLGFVLLFLYILYLVIYWV